MVLQVIDIRCVLYRVGKGTFFIRVVILVEYKQESSEFIRYQHSMGKVGDTLPSYPVYECTVVGRGETITGRSDRMAGEGDPAAPRTQRASGLDKLALGGGG